MEITEVRIKLMEDGGERLQAFCSITFDDCFVIRDLKIIEGANGPFVAMPSRKLTSHCPKCRSKNHLRANHCNECGARLSPNRVVLDGEGRAKLYADIAHPINSACREAIQERVIREFREEKVRAQQPGYVSKYDDLDYDDLPPMKPGKSHSGHPTTSFARSGSELASQLEGAQETPPPPHTGTASEGGSRKTAAAESTPGSAGKKDGFGAGIF